MGLSALLSAVLHLSILAIVIMGLPFKKVPDTKLYRPIAVDFIGPETMAPDPVLNPQKEDKPVDIETPKKAQGLPTSEPTPEPEPIPEPIKPEAPEPKPEPEPIPEPIKPEAPEPKPEPEPVPEPIKPEAPEPKPEPEPVPEPIKPDVPELKPEPKPIPEPIKPKVPEPVQDSLDAIVKELEKPKKPTPPKKKEKPKPTFDSILKNLTKNQEVADIIDPKEKADGKVSSQTGKVGPTLSVSEMDLIRQQFSKCWTIPAGAQEIHNLVVDVKVWMNPDGTVRDAKLLPSNTVGSPFYQTASESALRAVRDQRCLPLKLPLEKYETWKVFVLSFNPKDLL